MKWENFLISAKSSNYTYCTSKSSTYTVFFKSSIYSASQNRVCTLYFTIKNMRCISKSRIYAVFQNQVHILYHKIKSIHCISITSKYTLFQNRAYTLHLKLNYVNTPCLKILRIHCISK